MDAVMIYNVSMATKQGFELMTDTEHLRIRAHGGTISELFRNCLCGIAALMNPTVLAASKKAKKVKQILRVEAVDINTLLVAFLSEVIGLSDIHNLVFTNITFKNIGDNFLEGELSGVSAGEIEKEIKMVSYQDIEVTRNPVSGFYETTLVIDV